VTLAEGRQGIIDDILDEKGLQRRVQLKIPYFASAAWTTRLRRDHNIPIFRDEVTAWAANALPSFTSTLTQLQRPSCTPPCHPSFLSRI
jgi:hypothetical protein